jgi:hypothetical protein
MPSETSRLTESPIPRIHFAEALIKVLLTTLRAPFRVSYGRLRDVGAFRYPRDSGTVMRREPPTRMPSIPYSKPAITVRPAELESGPSHPPGVPGVIRRTRCSGLHAVIC